MNIPAALRRAVRERAGGCCEYCLICDRDSLVPHEPDHIIATQHGGGTAPENLALACYECNRPKGPNIASVDPQTGRPSFLFNPRQDQWAEHFRLDGPRIVPLTAMGRATAALLQFNTPDRIRLRTELQQAGRYTAGSAR